LFWFLTEGGLQKVVGRRQTDRYVFLFDGLIILTKQNKSRISVTGPVGEYKLKEKYHVRLLDITDRDDTDGKCVVVCRSILCCVSAYQVFFSFTSVLVSSIGAGVKAGTYS